MIDRGHALPLVAQARQLGISRGSIYYLPRPASDADLAIMRRIDELHLLYPFAGSGMLRDLLRREGVEVGRLHVATLMKRMRMRMRIEAIYRWPNTSTRAGAQDLSVPAAQADGDAAEPGVGDGHYRHPAVEVARTDCRYEVDTERFLLNDRGGIESDVKIKNCAIFDP